MQALSRKQVAEMTHDGGCPVEAGSSDAEMLGHWPISPNDPLSINEITGIIAETLEAPPMEQRAKNILRAIITAEKALNCDPELKKRAIIFAKGRSIAGYDMLDQELKSSETDMRDPRRIIAEKFADEFPLGEICEITFRVLLFSDGDLQKLSVINSLPALI